MLTRRRIELLVALALISGPAFAQTPAAVPFPWDSLGRVLGTDLASVAGAYRYNFPRADLHVRVGDVIVAPALALVGWAGFATFGSDTVVVGDLVVTTPELAVVLGRLAAEGVAVTAIHNHLAGEEPRLVFVHYMARGPALTLAMKIRTVLAATGTPLPVRTTLPQPVTIDTALVQRELGTAGKASGSVTQLGFDLVTGTVTMDGVTVPAALGLRSPINLQSLSSDRVVGTGDFAVTGDKVDGILKALAQSGITTTAVHSHLIGETPTMYFIHFWADGAPATVLRGLRDALAAAR